MYLYIYIFLSALGLCSSMGFSLIAVCGLLVVVASLVEERRLQLLQNVGSVVVAHGL